MTKYAGEQLQLNKALLEWSISKLKTHYAYAQTDLAEELENESQQDASGDIWQGAGSQQFIKRINSMNLLQLEILANNCNKLIEFLEKAKLEVEERDNMLRSTAHDSQEAVAKIKIE